MKLLALISICIMGAILSGPIIGGDDHDKIAYQTTKLTLKLNSKSIEELKSNALSIEDYVLKGKNTKLIDNIDILNKEFLMKYLIDICVENTELLEAEKYEAVVNNSYRTELFLEEPKKVGGLHDYIFRKDLETLKRWAFTCEAHDRHVTQSHLIGGLHDKIEKMSKEEIIIYVLDMSEKYPGLNSGLELDRLSGVYNISPKFFGKIGGLHDFIFRLPRETLIQWALTAEAHDRKIKNVTLYGGLEDVIQVMKDTQIAQYVLDKTVTYPELNSSETLDRLSLAYGISQPKKLTNTRFGGLHDYILRQNRNTLIKWALTCEFHDRKEKNLQLFGGLHDYIDTMKNQEIADYILRMADSYPTLNSSEQLENLSNIYGIVFESKKSLTFLTLEDNLEIEGGLNDYIWRESRETLIKWAFASELYDRELKQSKITGGIHDYIHSFTNEQIIEYVLRQAEVHKELNNSGFLNGLTEKYGMNSQ